MTRLTGRTLAAKLRAAGQLAPTPHPPTLRRSDRAWTLAEIETLRVRWAAPPAEPSRHRAAAIAAVLGRTTDAVLAAASRFIPGQKAGQQGNQ